MGASRSGADALFVVSGILFGGAFAAMAITAFTPRIGPDATSGRTRGSDSV